MSLDRDWILRHIPHQHDMCLLDEVIAWSETEILCRTGTHRDPANPLRARGRLPAVNGIEYAAQSMALHGALLAGRPAGPAYLASVRGVQMAVDRLDDLAVPLQVRSQRISGDATTILYQFALDDGGRTLLSGRIAVVLDVARPRIQVV